MRSRIIAKIGALFALGAFIALLVPGCVIRIGPGTGDETDPTSSGTTTGGGGQNDTDGGTTLTPEEQAAIEALQAADPQEVAMGTAAASYAAVSCANLVESQVADPNTVDPAAVEQLFDQYAPLAVDTALAWLPSFDPTLIQSKVYPEFECMNEPYSCPPTTFCPLGDGWKCVVSQCGKGACPWCPEFFGSLIYKGWCAYGCMNGNQYMGGAFLLRTRWGWNGPHCFPVKK